MNKKLSDVVQIIFYFVCPENVSLKEEKMQSISADIALRMDADTYAIRCGTDVQNPQELLMELSEMPLNSFGIIYVSKDGINSPCLLGIKEKELFVKELKTWTENTGLLAKKFVFSEEPTTKFE